MFKWIMSYIVVSYLNFGGWCKIEHIIHRALISFVFLKETITTIHRTNYFLFEW